LKKYTQGIFTPKHPERYCGPNINNIKYRSGWEHSVLSFLDQTGRTSILHWSSESISIPYVHPLLRRVKMYVPDFFVIYVDRNSKKHAEIWEIKPSKENPFVSKLGGQSKVAYKLKLINAINYAKFTAAIQYCAKRGWFFRIITEKELFYTNNK